jgi:Flp pilus assembly protein TadB
MQAGDTDWEQRLWSEQASRSGGIFLALGLLMTLLGLVLMVMGATAAVSLLLIGAPLGIYGARLVRRERRSAETSGAFAEKPHRGEPFWTHRGGASFGSRDQTA